MQGRMPNDTATAVHAVHITRSVPFCAVGYMLVYVALSELLLQIMHVGHTVCCNVGSTCVAVSQLLLLYRSHVLL